MSATDDPIVDLLDDTDESATQPVHGWRIARMQVVNWGGFDGWHEVLFDEAGTILTGGSGAGKSTLLDAYIAVMMSAKVPFNNASNAGRGRARGDGQRPTSGERSTPLSSTARPSTGRFEATRTPGAPSRSRSNAPAP